MNFLRFQLSRKFTGKKSGNLSLSPAAGGPVNGPDTTEYIPPAASLSFAALGLLWSGLLLAGCAPDRSQRLADCGGWLFLAGIFVGACAAGTLAWHAISGCAKGARGNGK